MKLTCDEATAYLADAKARLHKILMGRNVVGVVETDKRLDYDRGNTARLEQYVAQLQNKVDACNGVRSTARRILPVIPVDSNSNGC